MDIDRLLRRHAEGASNIDMAREFGVSGTMILRALKRRGLKSNYRGGTPRTSGKLDCRVDGCEKVAVTRGVCKEHKGHPAALPDRRGRKPGTTGTVTAPAARSGRSSGRTRSTRPSPRR